MSSDEQRGGGAVNGAFKNNKKKSEHVVSEDTDHLQKLNFALIWMVYNPSQVK